ncbi:ABC transporter ATP-binding protein [Natronolimnohabitans sp. A-GB9]|uniref:ABC transporter ATP-binding protein n=1 Tax=Natronolimnohabitans sp. A-GB9 TaxID=3069757 RepID=UPI0027B235E9|nr:ABC transporter ATP-binding protein [Natronolimnohabitans sp. A-GB9]MDQ2050874.1 ABC transporter ATP-binding protein [Natronolimnohabitans sp. A-GB9]
MLEVTGLTKYYGELLAVDDVSFHIDEGDFVTLLGPSGCGKTTLLHMIAGLREPTEGQVKLRGEDVTDLAPEDRNIGMAFQSTALFPHMTVRENIAYGLRMHGYDAEERDTQVQEFLELVDLPDHGDHHPDELSGGQQQRVSLARALAYEPDILLLDEPLTGLDRVLREEMREWLMTLQRELGVTSLYVTHDQEDALSMSDKVIVLDDGQKQQAASPERIYEQPANEFVATFVGKSTRFDGTLRSVDDRPIVETDETRIVVGTNDRATNHDDGEAVSLFVRPEDVDVEPATATADGGTTTTAGAASAAPTAAATVENAFPGTVEKIANLGNRTEVTVALESGETALANTARFPNIAVGDEVTVTFDSESVVVV